MDQAQPVQNQPAPQAAPTKGSNTALKLLLGLAIGCLVFVVIGFVGAGFVFQRLAKVGATKLAETAIEKSTGDKVNVNMNDLQNGSIDIKGQNGESFSTSTQLPTNFPTDVPLYTGAQIKSSITSKNPQNNENGFVVSLTTSDPASQVRSFYDSKLKDNGWTVKSTYETSGGFTLSAEKGTDFLIVGVTTESGVTALSITVTTK